MLCSLALCPSVAGGQCRVSGQVGSISPGSCRREQPRTAARHSAVWWPAPGSPPCLPPTHLDIILHTTRYLSRYCVRILPCRPVLRDYTIEVHAVTHLLRLSAIKYMNLNRHPKSVSVYEGTGQLLAPGEMKMGTGLDRPLCMRHDDRWRVGSAQSVPLLGFQASLLSGAPRPSPRPCSRVPCAPSTGSPAPSPPCPATLTAPHRFAVNSIAVNFVEIRAQSAGFQVLSEAFVFVVPCGVLPPIESDRVEACQDGAYGTGLHVA